MGKLVSKRAFLLGSRCKLRVFLGRKIKQVVSGSRALESNHNNLKNKIGIKVDIWSRKDALH